MPIAFECPHCGKRFKVADALAGRKAKCAGCGQTIKIPLPKPATTPPRPKIAAPDLDVYGLADDAGSTATATETEADDDAASSTGSLPKLGQRVGQMTVRESSPSRLSLANPTGRILLILLSGVAAIAAGLALAAGFEAWVVSARPARMLVLLILAPFALVGYGAGTFCYLARFGYRMTLDRASRSLVIRRFGFWDSTWTAEDLGGVVFCVLKLDNERCGDVECPQRAEAFVVDRGGTAVALLERISTKKSGDARRLADLCLHAGRLLGLPVFVELKGEPHRDELKRAVERIRGESLRRPAASTPKVRPPIFTVHTVAAAVVATTTLVGGGRFMLRYTTLGDAAAFAVDHVAPEQRSLLDMVQGDAPQEAPAPGQTPTNQIDRILQDLRSPDAAKRSFAAFQIQNREPDAEHRDSVRAVLKTMIESTDENERRRGLEALNIWGTDDDVPLFVKELEGPIPGAREVASVILARRKDPRGAEVMARLLHDKDRRFGMGVRLAEIGAPALPFVLPLLDDPDDEVKRAAVGVLDRIATRAEVPAMEAALNRILKTIDDPKMRNADPFTPEGRRRRELESVVFFLRNAIRQAGTRT